MYNLYLYTHVHVSCFNVNVCIHEAVLNYSVYTEGSGLPGLIFHPLMISTCADSGVGGPGAIDHILRQERGETSVSVR